MNTMKKTWKRLACCALAAGMIFGGLPADFYTGAQGVTVQAAQTDSGELTYQEGNSTYTYKIQKDDTVQITSYSGTDTEITVPGEIDEKKVTEIYGGAFIGSSLTSITIPSSIETIGNYSYTNYRICKDLASIQVAQGNSAYSSKDGILFSADGTELVAYPPARQGKTYEIPSTVTTIGQNAFYGCSNLTGITIPDSVNKIGSSAFSECTALESVHLPDGITEISWYLFSGCTNLADVNIPAGVTKIGQFGFQKCSNLTVIDIPVGVTKMGTHAFYGCSNLTGITIPSGVKNIDSSVFSGCTGLTAIQVAPGSESYCSVDGVLYNFDKTKLIKYPQSKAGDYAMPDTVTAVSATLSGCAKLTSVKLSDKITELPSNMFFGCKSLKEIQLPERMSRIGSSAFQNCSSLTSIRLPEGITAIEAGTFNGCSSLTDIQIPEGVTVIHSAGSVSEGAFSGCSSLTRIELPESLTSIGDGAFRYCSSLETIQIPSGVTSIGQKAFSSCSKVTLELPENLINLGWGALENCRAIKSVSIPESLESIGEAAFWGCRNLKTITVAPGNKHFVSVEDVLFNREMTRLVAYPAAKEGTAYTVPDTVKDVGTAAFMYCETLTDIVIPEGVTEIKLATFEGCTNLERLILPQSLTFMGNQVSSDCDKLKSIIIPKSVEHIGFKAWGYHSVIENGKRVEKVYDDFIIFGYANTAAQTYADQNGIRFVELDEKTSDTGVNIAFSKDDIANSAAVSLTAKQLSASDMEYQNIVLTDKLADTSIKPENVRFTAYDITLKNSAGTAVQPKGKVTVKIPVPAGYDGAKCKVYYVNEKGGLVDMQAVYTSGYMHFETTHFSTYMITETQLKATEEPAAIYGDANKDGTVNSKDVVMMKKHLAGYTVDIDLSVCDVNGDNTVNSKDVVLVMKKLAGYDVALGK